MTAATFVRELAAMLRLRPSDPIALMTYRFFFDDSGEGGPPRAVGGCVASYEAWERFPFQWNAVLSEFCVPYFHAKKLERREPPFDSWDGTNDKRELFRQALADVIYKLGLRPVCCEVRPHSIRRRQRRHAGNVKGRKDAGRDFDEMADDPYCISFSWCVGAVVERVAMPSNSVVHFIQAHQPGYIGWIARIYELATESERWGRHLGSISQGLHLVPYDQGDGNYTIELQAADFVAYYMTGYRRLRKVTATHERLRKCGALFHLADPGHLFEGWDVRWE